MGSQGKTCVLVSFKSTLFNFIVLLFLSIHISTLRIGEEVQTSLKHRHGF